MNESTTTTLLEGISPFQSGWFLVSKQKQKKCCNFFLDKKKVSLSHHLSHSKLICFCFPFIHKKNDNTTEHNNNNNNENKENNENNENAINLPWQHIMYRVWRQHFIYILSLLKRLALIKTKSSKILCHVGKVAGSRTIRKPFIFLYRIILDF